MQRLRPRRVIGIVFFVLVLMVGAKVTAIVTAVPQPPLPPLLQALGSAAVRQPFAHLPQSKRPLRGVAFLSRRSGGHVSSSSA